MTDREVVEKAWELAKDLIANGLVTGDPRDVAEQIVKRWWELGYVE